MNTDGLRADKSVERRVSRDQVAVAIPLYRDTLSAEETVSVRHLRHYLQGFELYAFLPGGLQNPLPGVREERFPAEFFDSVESYSRLLLSSDFYRRFAKYEFLLIYQLDSLVFSGRLLDWCNQGFDYIGAPWLLDRERPFTGFSRVGNGGFSLRRVEAFLRVLAPDRSRGRPPLAKLLSLPMPDLKALSPWSGLLKRVQVAREACRGVDWYSSRYTLNEDRFWSDRARLFSPDFLVAPIEVGLGFSFECAPRYCWERNGQRLPFGCHGWWRYDRQFWEPSLLEPLQATCHPKLEFEKR